MIYKYESIGAPANEKIRIEAKKSGTAHTVIAFHQLTNK